MKASKLLRTKELELQLAGLSAADPHPKLAHCRRGLVTDLAGPASTLVCRQSLAYTDLLHFLNLPDQKNSNAVLIDSLGTIQPRVLADELAALLPARTKEGPAQVAALLDRIHLTRVFNAHGLAETLQEMIETLYTQSERAVAQNAHTATASAHVVDGRIGLLLISNITNPLALLIQRSAGLHAAATGATTGTATEGHALMVQLMRQLRILANTFGVTVILLNNTVRAGAAVEPQAQTVESHAVGKSRNVHRRGFAESAFSEVPYQPALGKSWPHLVDVQLLVHACTDLDASFEMPAEEGPRQGFLVECIKSRVGGVGNWYLL